MPRSGFKSQRVEVQGAAFNLIELSAQQRIDYLRRASTYNANNGFELIDNNLAITSDLIALHLRRRFLPQWLVRRKVRNLPDSVLVELFSVCVDLSNIPFAIRPVESGADSDVSADELADSSSDPEDD